MIDISLLWYDFFYTTLSDLGFKLNPYEKYIPNKVINEHQCTTIWFVEDNKVSHMDDKIKSIISEKIEKHFEKISCTTGNKHMLIGIDI